MALAPCAALQGGLLVAHLLLHVPQLLCHLHALALELVHLRLLPERGRRQHRSRRGQRRIFRRSLPGRRLLLLLLRCELPCCSRSCGRAGSR